MVLTLTYSSLAVDSINNSSTIIYPSVQIHVMPTSYKNKHIKFTQVYGCIPDNHLLIDKSTKRSPLKMTLGRRIPALKTKPSQPFAQHTRHPVPHGPPNQLGKGQLCELSSRPVSTAPYLSYTNTKQGKCCSGSEAQ